MGIFRFDRAGQIVGVRREAASRTGWREIGQSIPPGAHRSAGHTPEKPFVASMGVYVFSRDVLLDLLAADTAPGTSAAKSFPRRSAATG